MDELTIIVYTLVLLALVFASLTDLHKREVPDTLNYGLMVAGISLRIVASYVDESWMPLLEGLLGLGIFFGLGAAMFYSGQWGGGDAKLLFGMGAMIGIPLEVPALQSLPFLASFLIDLIIVGALYGTAWSIFLAVKHRKKFTKKLAELLNERPVRRLKMVLLGVIAALLVMVYLSPLEEVKIPLLVMGMVLIASFYLFFVVRSVEQVCMYKDIAVDKLVEGDWIADEVMVDKKLLLREGKITAAGMAKIKAVRKLQFSSSDVKTSSFLRSTITFSPENIKEGDELLEDLHTGVYICGPEDLGISKEQIAMLRKHKISSVLVREGIPFVPSFLIAYVMTLALGGHLLAWFL